VDAVVRRECDMPQVGATDACRASSRSAAPRCSWVSGGEGGGEADQDLSYRIESQVWMVYPLGNVFPRFRAVHSREEGEGEGDG
jgi:hypothetical protein